METDLLRMRMAMFHLGWMTTLRDGKSVLNILNRPEPENTASIPKTSQDIDINIEPLSVQEIKKAINEMKNGKALGAASICAELLKAE